MSRAVKTSSFGSPASLRGFLGEPAITVPVDLLGNCRQPFTEHLANVLDRHRLGLFLAGLIERNEFAVCRRA